MESLDTTEGGTLNALSNRLPAVSADEGRLARMTDDIDGAWFAGTLSHYTEHGRYWNDNILASTDEAFNGICAGDYFWLKV